MEINVNTKVWCSNDLELQTLLRTLEENGWTWASGSLPTSQRYRAPIGLYLCVDDKSMCQSANKNYYDELNDGYTKALVSNLCSIELEEWQMICPTCGDILNKDDAIYTDWGEIYCESCIGDHTYNCTECGRLCPIGCQHYDGRIMLCDDCYEDYYTCEHCGCFVHVDDVYFSDDYSDEAYCPDCWRNYVKRFIHDYYYKPDPIFYGESPFFMGVELEIDGAGEDDDNANVIVDTMNCDKEHIYCKHDGSLNDGFEIVSHPASLEYHANNMNWENMMKEAVDMGYKSHNARTCGLHVHVSRKAFGNTYDEQEIHIGKVIYFVAKHWNELLKFSRRTREQLERWAKRYGIYEDVKSTYDNAKGENDYTRYVCVNLEPRNTIEFRFFRGTLKYSTFLATLQLVDAICKTVVRLTEEEMQNLSWSDFVSDIKHPELIEYLKQKRLYINEEIDEVEEDI